ncbi:MAG: flap structure-specific endonuclease, partial [Methanomassiliicoccales archaeon]
MGVNLSEIVPSTSASFETLAGKYIAVDAYNAIYQFLSVIRQPNGMPLIDSKGRITSHLAGLLYRNANLLEMGVLPVYV